MEEEKKEISEREVVNKPSEELLNLKRNNSKKNSIIIVLVFIIVLMLTIILLYYFNNKDNNSNTNNGNNGTPIVTPTPETNKDVLLTNDEAIKIAKEKVEAANNFFGDFESSFECENSIEDGYCYYDTVDNFKKKFYSIYSSELSYSNVYNDVTNSETFNFLFGAQIKIKDNKVYVWNHCTEGTNGYSLKGDYSVKSTTVDAIVVKYIMHREDYDLDINEDEDAEVKLVKENNEWKVMKVTIIGRCTSAYEVGK